MRRGSFSLRAGKDFTTEARNTRKKEYFRARRFVPKNSVTSSLRAGKDFTTEARNTRKRNVFSCKAVRSEKFRDVFFARRKRLHHGSTEYTEEQMYFVKGGFFQNIQKLP